MKLYFNLPNNIEYNDLSCDLLDYISYQEYMVYDMRLPSDPEVCIITINEGKVSYDANDSFICYYSKELDKICSVVEYSLNCALEIEV